MTNAEIKQALTVISLEFLERGATRMNEAFSRHPALFGHYAHDLARERAASIVKRILRGVVESDKPIGPSQLSLAYHLQAGLQVGHRPSRLRTLKGGDVMIDFTKSSPLDEVVGRNRLDRPLPG